MPLSRITSASIDNSAISAADIADGTITAAKIISVANTQITGNIVSSQIAPSIVLNTPALGTPASGVLTNCTGVPAAALPAGSVLQVVQGSYAIQVNNTTTTFADTNLTATITPKFSTSKILVLVNQNGCGKENGSTDTSIILQLLRSSTVILAIDGVSGFTLTSVRNYFGSITCSYIDTPATTSATTYKTQFKNSQNVNGVSVQASTGGVSTSTMTLMEIAV